MNLQWQKYPHNARKLFKLTIPIFISQLSASGMGLADIVMAFHCSFLCSAYSMRLRQPFLI